MVGRLSANLKARGSWLVARGSSPCPAKPAKAPLTRSRGSIHLGSALTASLKKAVVYTSPESPYREHCAMAVSPLSRVI